MSAKRGISVSESCRRGCVQATFMGQLAILMVAIKEHELPWP